MTPFTRHLAAWILVFASALALSVEAARADVTGRATALDGDTLELSGTRVTLYGVDAPEHDQTCQTRQGRPYDCGTVATRSLAVLVSGRTVVCESRGRDATGETLGVCRLGRVDVAEQMAVQGWALADPTTGAAYLAVEAAARANGDGMWKGQFLAPWEWRAQLGRTTTGRPATAPGGGACISGIVDLTGAECPRLLGRGEARFALLGDLAGLEHGLPACLCGSPSAVSFCMEGTAFSVTHIGRPEDCAPSQGGEPTGTPRE